jgi:hypothetical protein
MRPVDAYFHNTQEPVKSCLIFLREHLLTINGITEAWKYGMPFYCYRGKMICYLWIHKKYNQPYLGVVEGKKIDHPRLIQEKRARMKILLLDPDKDIPIRLVNRIMKEVLNLYRP